MFQSFFLDRGWIVLLVGDALDLGLEVRSRRHHRRDARPADPLNQHPTPPVGQLEHAHDHGDRAHLEQVRLLRLFRLFVALRGQQDHAILGQSLIDGLNRDLPRHRQRCDDERIDDHVPQRQDRQLVGDPDLLLRFLA